jgi:hypothetical protein
MVPDVGSRDGILAYLATLTVLSSYLTDHHRRALLSGDLDFVQSDLQPLNRIV